LLARLLSWACKVGGIDEAIAAIRDGRRRGRIRTSVVIRSALLLFLTRLGSLNALEQTRSSARWRRWLGADLPSADTLGRVMAGIELETLRGAIGDLYRNLKRGKALQATAGGLVALVIDGHQSYSTYHRRCGGCLERRVKTKAGYRTQYYHHWVVAMLLSRPIPMLLDLESLRTGEDEITAAVRLLERILLRFPRAFDVVVADALYSDPRIYRLLCAHHKDVISVLKANTPELLEEANDLVRWESPAAGSTPDYQLWDVASAIDWPAAKAPLRFLRLVETRQVRRQLDQKKETLLSHWMWMTTLSPNRASTTVAVTLARARWDIENLGFNETVRRWHIDHVYRHHPIAMTAFWLLGALAYGVFHAFYHRGLKPALQQRGSYLHLARCLAAELYARPDAARPPPS
jgi:hypothetical protein